MDTRLKSKIVRVVKLGLRRCDGEDQKSSPVKYDRRSVVSVEDDRSLGKGLSQV
jgi:hypothetical protein